MNNGTQKTLNIMNICHNSFKNNNNLTVVDTWSAKMFEELISFLIAFRPRSKTLVHINLQFSQAHLYYLIQGGPIKSL